MPKIEIDEDLCVGTGDCVANAPEAFSIDDSSGTAEPTEGAPSVALPVLQRAAYDCPTGAITIIAD